jgi:flagellar biosynthesis protein FlhB
MRYINLREMLKMVVFMIIGVYLIIGAILACKNRELIDDVHEELMGESPIAKHKWFMRIFAIVIMLMLPILEMRYFIRDIINELKWMKTKRELRKEITKAKKTLNTMQAKLDDKSKD